MRPDPWGGPMTEHDDALSLDMVTAALRADSTDVAIYARVLAQSLGEALPSDSVTVERERSMSDRMRGRPGEISKVVAKLGELQMTLAVRNGQPVTEICRAVRGVVLSRQTVPVGGVGRDPGQRAGRLRRAERPGRAGAAPAGRRQLNPAAAPAGLPGWGLLRLDGWCPSPFGPSVFHDREGLYPGKRETTHKSS